MNLPLIGWTHAMAALLVFCTVAVFAETGAPEPAEPAAAEISSPGGDEGSRSTDSEPQPAPVTEPEPALPATLRDTVSAMSVADIQETMNQLKENYIRSEAFSDEQLSRALLEGTIARLGPGAMLLGTPNPASPAPPFPFYAEILDERIGYLRIGNLNEGMLGQLDAAIERFNGQNIAAAVIDLRSSGMTADFETAVGVIERFVPKGKLLFTIRRPGEKQERIFTSNEEPTFQGILMILTDGDTAGPAEVLAASVRELTKSMVVGATTAGQAVEYSDRQLRGGQILRMAVAEIDIPGIGSIFPEGLRPDIAVPVSPETKERIIQSGVEQGVSGLVFDKERPRRNEAALVAGTLPNLDEFQSPGETGPDGRLRDRVLQRAVDLITTISIYESQPGSR